MFVDRVSIAVKAGDGGNGKMSFRREKFVAMGGPDGGDGGHGGDVVLRASNNQNTLATFRYKKLLQAKDGEGGGQRKKHGKNGDPLELDVPVGTVFINKDGEVLADLIEDGQTEVIAIGGRGGFGNSHFVSSTRQAPKIAEKGEKGDYIEGVFELKMIADVGLIGLPNAGKSTLLSVVSNAKPEIANYPFTTIRPNLGVLDVDKRHSLLLADIPGLIEGASQGKGLGDEFLRHVERTRLLVHLIDVYTNDLGLAYKTIIGELKAYKTDLSGLPQIVALTKVEGLDKDMTADRLKELKKSLPKNTKVFAISAQSGQGVKELVYEIDKQISAADKIADIAEPNTKLPVIGLKPVDNGWSIKSSGKRFIITGNKIERFAQRTHFGDEFSEERLRDIMQKMGIIKELENRGVEDGQTIQFGADSVSSLEY